MSQTSTSSTPWAPITLRRGVPEVTVQWVANNLHRIRLVDVREPEELVGPLGKIEDAQAVPLRTVPDAARGWGRDEAVVVLCRSGARSGQAASYLTQQGFTQVASMAGGMLEWNAFDLPVV